MVDPTGLVRIHEEEHGWAWYISTAALAVYSFGLAMFALLPLLPGPNPLLFIEAVIGISGMGAFLGLVSLIITRRRNGFLRRWAFLMAGFSGFATFLGFSLAEEGASTMVKFVVGLFVWSGILGSWGAHLEYGGRHSIREALEER